MAGGEYTISFGLFLVIGELLLGFSNKIIAPIAKMAKKRVTKILLMINPCVFTPAPLALPVAYPTR